MKTLLHLDSSPMGNASVSRSLTAEFVKNWQRQHPDGKVITRDLTATTLPVISAASVGATFTPEDARTPEQQALLTTSDALIAELEQADEYVIGVPMHNFTIASVLRLWIDQVVRAGRTFSYADGTPKGLLENKKAHFMVASGGVYGEGTPMASYNFVEPYLRTIFGFMGVIDTSFLVAGGASALNYGKIDLPTFLDPHLETIRSQFQVAA